MGSTGAPAPLGCSASCSLPMRGKDGSCLLLPSVLAMGTPLLPPGELCGPQLLLTQPSKVLSSPGTAPWHPQMCGDTGTSEHP